MKTGLLAGMMILGLSTSAAMAQFRAMPPDPYDAHQGAQAAAAPAQTGSGAQPAYPATNDYPAAEVQAVPVARARATMTRVQLDEAQSAVHLVVDELKEDFEYSADLAAALRGEKISYDRFIAARDRVLKQVATDPKYQTLKHLASDLNDRLYSLKAQPAANKDEIVATAQLKLVYATQISDMESDALKADGTVQDTKNRLIDASTKVADMRADFRRSVRRDQKFVAAKQQMDEARVARLTAAAFLDGAVEARDIALDYAYYLHFHDPYTYRYTGGYDYGYPYYDNNVGYGYGYNTGFNSGVVVNPIYRPNRWR